MNYSETLIPVSEFTPPLLALDLQDGIPSRGITHETCNLYRTYRGAKPLEVYHYYYSQGDLCGVKARRGGWTTGKKETYWFPGSKRSLFGSHLWEGQVCSVYVFEGETDAMAMSQAVGSDGLCLAYGGKPSEETLLEWIDLIRSVGGDVHLCFDADPDGDAYTQQFRRLWGDGDLLDIVLPPETKDVAQLLLEGGTPAFKPLTYDLPPNLLTGDALVTTHSHAGKDHLSTGHTYLDLLIGGYAPGNIIVLTGPTKSGKSAFTADLTVNFLRSHPGKVLYIPLELSVDETMQVLASASLGVHLTEADSDLMRGEREKLAPRILMAKHFGFLPIDDLDTLLKCIPYTGEIGRAHV